MIEIVVTTVTILAGVVTLLSYFSKEKSQSDGLLYREYIADAKT